MAGRWNRTRLVSLVRTNGILLLDGGIGTELAGRIQGRPDSAMVNLSCPEAVISVHSDYIRAGADVITTNSFNLINQTGETTETLRRSAVAAVELAREAIYRYECESDGREILIAASVGPSTPMTAQSGAAYSELFRSLILAGADVLLLETMTSIQAAETALVSAREAMEDTQFEVPLAVSAVVSHDGTLPGDHSNLSDFLKTVGRFDPAVLGINCVTDIAMMRDNLKQIGESFEGLIAFYPSAGLPQESVNPFEPHRFADQMADLISDTPVDIIGGCCGTTAYHIRSLAAIRTGVRPHLAR